MESVEINLDRLFSLADNSNMCRVIVRYKNGYKEYRICDGNGEVILNGDLEEDIFLLFRYPEIYVDKIDKYLFNNKQLMNRYFDNPNIVRHELRIKFKDLLYEIAKRKIAKKLGISVEELESKEKSGKEESVSIEETTESKPKVVVVKHIESKPIHKSKTVVVNSGLIATGLGLIANGIWHRDIHSIEKGFTILIPAVINFILRLVTKVPIRL